jgi:H+/Cl- antiporter ClcA
MQRGPTEEAPDPYAVMRSPAYVRLLLTAAVLGVPIAAAAFWFLQLVSVAQRWLFTDLPGTLGYAEAPWWWPLPPLCIGGVLVGLAVHYLPGRGGHSPADGMAVGGGPPRPQELLGITAAALASLICGAVVGPEAPLIALGGGLAYGAARLARRDLPSRTGAVVGATGSFAAISTLFGSPLGGAFLLMEATGLGGAMATAVLVPGMLAAGIGSLVFVGLGRFTGYGVFSLAIPDVPPFGELHAVQFLWAVAIGLLAAPLCWALLWAARAVRRHTQGRPVLLTPVLGLAIAGSAITYQALSGRGAEEVLFSGQSALPALVDQGAEYTVGALVLLTCCKGFAYVCALAGFRGGPTFPAMFIGASGGAALSHLPGLPLVPAIAMGIAAMTAGVLKLPLTAVLLTTILFGVDGVDGVTVMPLVITASVVSYVVTVRLMPAPAAPSTPPPSPGHQVGPSVAPSGARRT